MGRAHRHLCGKKRYRTIWARTRIQACIDASTYSRSDKYTQKYDYKQAETETTNVNTHTHTHTHRSRHRCRRRTFADLRLRQLFDLNSGLWSPWKLPPLEPLEPLEEPLPAAYPIAWSARWILCWVLMLHTSTMSICPLGHLPWRERPYLLRSRPLSMPGGENFDPVRMIDTCAAHGVRAGSGIAKAGVA